MVLIEIFNEYKRKNNHVEIGILYRSSSEKKKKILFLIIVFGLMMGFTGN